MLIRSLASTKKLLKIVRESALEDNKQIPRMESCKWIPKECCVWMVDRENQCYHTECGNDYYFGGNRKGGFCTYCGKLIAIPCIEEDGECLSFSN